MRTPTPLSSITQLGVGCQIAATRFIIRSIVKTFNSKPDSPKVWHAHICSVEDNGFRCEVKFWNRDIGEIKNLIGHQIEVEASESKGKVRGLEITEDNRQNIQLSISENCSISWIDGGQNQAPRQQQQQPQQQRYPSGNQGGYQQQAPRPQQPQQGSQGSRSQPPKTILGITVGMAIKEACTFISNSTPPEDLAEFLNTPEFSRDLHRIASDIIRISQLLESNQLADRVKDRVQPQAPRQQQERSAPPQRTPDRAPPPTQDEGNQDFGEGPITDMGLEGDDIPFN